jgi:hypothetical protein
MYRSVLTSLTVVSLTLIAVPSSAQQPTTRPAPRAQPVGVVQQQDCPKLIQEINAATAVRFDPTAANARQTAIDAAKLQADGKYTECFSTAQATNDALIASAAASAPVYPQVQMPRFWAHPDEDIGWVQLPQRP